MYENIVKISKSTQKAALCIITQTKGSTPRKVGSKMLVYDDGKILGTIGGGALEKQVIDDAIEVIKSGEPKYFTHCLAVDLNMSCGGNVDIYIEPILKKKKLHIFGAGHIGKVLAKFALELDFQVTVIDERENIFETWEKEKFEIINKHFSEIREQLVFDENLYITVLTHTHENDKEITGFCAKQNFAYLGMIGSKRKIKQFSDYFLENKALTQEQIDKINMPMGIPIYCQTPEEIAISILAKLIDVRGGL
jgi:xanthine dehydrogenase accessory factor